MARSSYKPRYTSIDAMIRGGGFIKQREFRTLKVKDLYMKLFLKEQQFIIRNKRRKLKLIKAHIITESACSQIRGDYKGYVMLIHTGCR